MTNKQHSFRKSLIQKIQIVKHNVFADDEERKAFMLSRFGVDSTTKLSIDELKQLLDFCNRKVSDVPIAPITQAQVFRINNLWLQKARNKTIEAMGAFASKIAKREVCFINELRKGEATSVIVALEKMR